MSMVSSTFFCFCFCVWNWDFVVDSVRLLRIFVQERHRKHMQTWRKWRICIVLWCESNKMMRDGSFFRIDAMYIYLYSVHIWLFPFSQRVLFWISKGDACQEKEEGAVLAGILQTRSLVQHRHVLYKCQKSAPSNGCLMLCAQQTCWFSSSPKETFRQSNSWNAREWALNGSYQNYNRRYRTDCN